MTPLWRRAGALGTAFFLLSGGAPVFAYVNSNTVFKGSLGCLLGIGLGVYLFFWGFSQWRTKRLMQDIPLSTIRAMAPGLVEVTGAAVEWNPLEGPMTRDKCVYYQYRIEQYVSSGKNSHWETILSGDSRENPFFLQDDTGAVMVAPVGCKVVIPHDYQFETGMFTDVPPHINEFMGRHGLSCHSFFGFEKKLRFTEHNLKPSEKVFAVGTCQETAVLPPGPPAGAKEGICLAKGQRSGDVFILSDESRRELESSYSAHALEGILGGLALIGGCLYALLNLLGVR